MKLAVCLLTCDRPNYTKTTLESFSLYNPDIRHQPRTLYHADDGSTALDNYVLASKYAFTTVWGAKKRTGQGAALNAMWARAAEEGATHILHLENDWQWTAPIPAPPEEAVCLRLYGAQKARGGPRAATGTRTLPGNELTAWTPLEGGLWERGRTHWAGPPSITDVSFLLPAANGAARIKDITNRLTLDTLRPVENIVWHIGEETTQ